MRRATNRMHCLQSAVGFRVESICSGIGALEACLIERGAGDVEAAETIVRASELHHLNIVARLGGALLVQVDADVLAALRPTAPMPRH